MAIVATGEMAVTPDLKGFESKMSSSLGGIAKKAALAFGGAFVATKAVDFLGSAIADARESNKVAAQTAAVIKSTGSAANVSAKQVDQLAGSISRKTGIDDEQIAKASNLLLTFTNVRNEVGKGNDIFNQATKIATDMGAALGTDAAGSAIQLGKALNDPIKGISALSRVGVTFDEVQKKQIKNFVESGKTAEAQKIILAELAKEFGGSAEAQATASDKLKVTIGNLKEDLGNKLIPVIDKVATFLADKLPGALDTAGRAFGTVIRIVEPVVSTIKNLFANLSGGFTDSSTEFVSRFDETFFKLGQTLKTLVTFVMENKEVLVGFGAAIATVLVPAFVSWAVAAGAAAVATIAAAAPVIAVAAAVGLLVAGLVYAYNHWTGFREVVQAVASFITQTLIPALGSIVSKFSVIKDVGVIVFQTVKDQVVGFVNAIKTEVQWVQRLIDKIAQIKLPKLPGGRGAASTFLGGVIPGAGLLGFDKGGVVPGRIGAPMLAMVHGGERVLTPQQQVASDGRLFGDLIIQGATFEGADRTASAVVRELRAEAYRQGR